MARLIRLFIGIVLAGVLVGCASMPAHFPRAARYVPKQDRQVGAAKTAQSPRLQIKTNVLDKIEVFSLRPLQPGDKLAMSLMGIGGGQTPAFQTVIDESGNLNLPYIGTIHVAGLTKSQAEKAIERAYIDGEIYKSITVSIVPPDAAFYVYGEVRKPSGYPLNADTKLLQAIATAGGFTEFANHRDVTVKRIGLAPFTIDAQRIEDGKEKDQSVQAGDVINVGRTWH